MCALASPKRMSDGGSCACSRLHHRVIPSPPPWITPVGPDSRSGRCCRNVAGFEAGCECQQAGKKRNEAESWLDFLGGCGLRQSISTFQRPQQWRFASAGRYFLHCQYLAVPDEQSRIEIVYGRTNMARNKI